MSIEFLKLLLKFVRHLLPISDLLIEFNLGNSTRLFHLLDRIDVLLVEVMEIDLCLFAFIVLSILMLDPIVLIEAASHPFICVSLLQMLNCLPVKICKIPHNRNQSLLVGYHVGAHRVANKRKDLNVR